MVIVSTSVKRQLKKQTGFTLIEVMVAISMFAMISLAAAQMLRTMTTSHAITQDRIEVFRDLTRALTVIERDFSQILPRGVKGEYGDPLPPLMVGTGSYPAEFTRSGWSNPLGRPRSELQRVAYELNDEGELRRYFWLVLDRAQDSEPIRQTLLTGVKDFRINLLDEDGDTKTAWPVNTSASASASTSSSTSSSAVLPLAVEVFIETELLGEIRRVYAMVEQPQ